ncbi:hypothetical protein KJ840_05575 [Patescibacteria group bacterium]|nr:hypothetical protein [Patescibacteria group bacterium]
MKKILVVYYSRTGTTEKVAGQLAKKLDADLEEIVDQNSRKGVVGYLRSGRDAIRKKEIFIEPVKKDPAQYDLVVIGTPVWAFTMSAPVRTYLNSYKDKFNQIAFFTSQGGDKEQKVFKDMERLAGKPSMARMFITTKEAVNDKFAGKLDEFIQQLSARY